MRDPVAPGGACPRRARADAVSLLLLGAAAERLLNGAQVADRLPDGRGELLRVFLAVRCDGRGVGGRCPRGGRQGEVVNRFVHRIQQVVVCPQCLVSRLQGGRLGTLLGGRGGRLTRGGFLKMR